MSSVSYSQYRKAYLIVGASSGIGKVIASHLVSQDCLVVLLSRRIDKLRELSSSWGDNVLAFECDVTKTEDISKVFNCFESHEIKFSGMIYSAGVLDVKPAKNMPDGEIENIFAVNTFGFYNMCRMFQNRKYSYDGASIVAISSYASISKERGLSAYASSKAALNTLVEVLAKEFVKRSFRVNAILPGKTMSRMGSDIDEWSQEELEERAKGQSLGIIPLKEVVELVEYLLSEKSAHITGALLPISSGYCSD